MKIPDERWFNHINHSTENILLDGYLEKGDWISVSINYKARGGERVLTLGCFESSNSEYKPKILRDGMRNFDSGPILLIDDVDLRLKK